MKSIISLIVAARAERESKIIRRPIFRRMIKTDDRTSEYNAILGAL